jgi:hypothetical protein
MSSEPFFHLVEVPRGSQNWREVGVRDTIKDASVAGVVGLIMESKMMSIELASKIDFERRAISHNKFSTIAPECILHV